MDVVGQVEASAVGELTPCLTETGVTDSSQSFPCRNVGSKLLATFCYIKKKREWGQSSRFVCKSLWFLNVGQHKRTLKNLLCPKACLQAQTGLWCVSLLLAQDMLLCFAGKDLSGTILSPQVYC